MKRFVLLLLKTYKNTLSKVFVNLFGHGCRFDPTCSEYAAEAIDRHGAYKGLSLSFKRFLRCNPLSNKYYDPVPNKLLKE